MAGLNIRVSQDGTCLYFSNKPKFIAKINLQEPNFPIERVYAHKEFEDLVKFEADILGTDVASLCSDGTFKVSEKNLCYKLSTKRTKIFKQQLDKSSLALLPVSIRR